MFSVHTTPEKLENATIIVLCLRKTRAGESRDYRDVIVFENLRFQNDFRPHLTQYNNTILLIFTDIFIHIQQPNLHSRKLTNRMWFSVVYLQVNALSE